MNGSGSNNNGNGNSSLYREVRERVSQLDFSGFQVLVLLWLRAKGYARLTSLGRVHRRGRRLNGGADYLAYVDVPMSVPIAVQIRHWKTPLQRSVVDQMYGFLLRNHLPLGLIVTSSTVSRAALKAPQQYPGRQIELMSVSRLVSSMMGLGLAVRSASPLQLDEPFFRMLEHVTVASRLDGPSASPKVRARGRLTLPVLASELAMDPRLPSGNLPLYLLAAALLVTLMLLTLKGLR